MVILPDGKQRLIYRAYNAIFWDLLKQKVVRLLGKFSRKDTVSHRGEAYAIFAALMREAQVKAA